MQKQETQFSFESDFIEKRQKPKKVDGNLYLREDF